MQTTSQVFADGARNFVIRLTGVQDGTGIQETLVKKIDVSLMTPPGGPHFQVNKIDATILGGIVQLLWDAPAPEVFANLQLAEDHDWSRFGGVHARGVADATGSILLSTLGFDVGSSYDLTLECVKNVGNPRG